MTNSSESFSNSMEPKVTNSESGKKNSASKTIVVLLVLVLVVAAVYFLLVARKGDKMSSGKLSTNNSMQQAGEWDPDADPEVDSETAVVLATEDGFSPKELNIKTGTVVVWDNQSGDTITVDSSPHPQHTDYPFLNLGELAPGDKFSLIFDTPGTYRYHNHLDSSQTGTIKVTE